MKKIMIAALGLTLLSGTAVFAQNTSTGTGSMGSTDTMSKHKKMKKHKGGSSTMSDSSSTMSSPK